MPTILFVCTANIIRSPIAEAILAHQFSNADLPENWSTLSAGTWARDGYPAAKESQEILKLRGIDLSQHRSRIVNEELLQRVDLILVMERGHQEALQFEFPVYSERIYLLSEMAGLKRDVRDPVGGSYEDFIETIRDIDQYIHSGFSRILELARLNSAMKDEKGE